MDAYEILVLILSITLAICLILAMTCLIFMIYILKSVKRIMIKAEAVAGNVEEASELLKNTSLAAAAVKIVGNAVGFVSKLKGNEKDGK